MTVTYTQRKVTITPAQPDTTFPVMQNWYQLPIGNLTTATYFNANIESVPGSGTVGIRLNNSGPLPINSTVGVAETLYLYYYTYSTPQPPTVIPTPVKVPLTLTPLVGGGFGFTHLITPIAPEVTYVCWLQVPAQVVSGTNISAHQYAQNYIVTPSDSNYNQLLTTTTTATDANQTANNAVNPDVWTPAEQLVVQTQVREIKAIQTTAVTGLDALADTVEVSRTTYDTAIATLMTFMGELNYWNPTTLKFDTTTQMVALPLGGGASYSAYIVAIGTAQAALQQAVNAGYNSGAIGTALSTAETNIASSLASAKAYADASSLAAVNASSVTAAFVTITGGGNGVIQMGNGVITAGTVQVSELAFSATGATGPNSLVAAINSTADGIVIDANKVQINGSTTFATGYNPSTKLAPGSAANDINNNTTTINGGMITTRSIAAGSLDTSFALIDQTISSSGFKSAASNGGTTVGWAIYATPQLSVGGQYVQAEFDGTVLIGGQAAATVVNTASAAQLAALAAETAAANAQTAATANAAAAAAASAAAAAAQALAQEAYNLAEHGGCCVRKDTLVSSAYGDVAIKDIHLLSSILVKDFTAGGTAMSNVVGITRTLRDSHYQVQTQEGSNLFITGDHPMYSNGWSIISPLEEYNAYRMVYEIPLKNLTLSETVSTFGDIEETVTSISPVNATQVMYTLTVKHKDHNYYANNILVHNAGSGGACLAGETLIATPTGDKTLESLDINDVVYSWVDGTLMPFSITSTVQVYHTLHYQIRTQDGKILRISQDHPVLTTTGWKVLDPTKAKNYTVFNLNLTKLAVGDILVGPDGQHVVKSLTPISGGVRLFTVGLRGSNNFIANGLVVHDNYSPI